MQTSQSSHTHSSSSSEGFEDLNDRAPRCECGLAPITTSWKKDSIGKKESGDASIISQTMSDNLHMKLLYLENRVAFARLFFPTEAKVPMDIAHAETTFEFSGQLSAPKGVNGNLGEVDLNETPITQNKRLLSRLEALTKTVEMGRRYFPNCSEVLDKFMEDDLPDLFYIEKGRPDQQRIKRMHFIELKDDVQKAFNKDKAEHSVLSSSL